ncbi:hypothetical protein CY34DRAFT_14105 [Suillus luteus UH-Slu-Lm8-n1]|uniref:Uncharacterized protein n=1 Tax=Suillus luteus UH-Slu-Lm8-n1 TaxID=930992 RepID=A0A0C9ZQ86_9AGAM|nr:hypothetical protein CY34DRAFT_14105 [Suillus luteus UH-Slu-Lm8-n1]
MSCHSARTSLATRQLSVVNIKYFQPASPIDITVFMESLSTSCQNYASLKHIYVAETTDPEDSDLVIPLSSEVFRPLLKFTGLLSVAFGSIGNYNLDDRFINDIPDAWPGIHELKFASYRPASCAVTFTAMVSLASRCRSLQSLYLTCSATQSTIIPQAEDGTEKFSPAQTALRELHLGYSQVSEVARMPYILAKVFLALSFLDWYHFFGSFDIENSSERALEEVRYQLQVLQNLADPDDHDDIDDSDVEWEDDDDDAEDSE